MVGKKGRSGPKPGNLNSAKSGSALSKRLTVGELPAKMIAVKREGRAYRREIEDEVLSKKGEITLSDAHHIDTASAATITAGIARWLLRNRIDKMTTTEILNCSASITKAKQARDSAIKALGLDAAPPAPWAFETTAKSVTTDRADEKEGDHDAT